MTSPVHIAFIAFGSNLGDKTQYCLEAIQHIQTHPQCEVLRVSSLYETEPLVKAFQEAQPWYLNGVLKIRTQLNAVKLLQFLLEIETKLGRDPQHAPWSPRPIDLDLLFFNDEIIKTVPLQVPHPELHKRRFVLEPLSEIAPEWVHPVKGKNIETLLQELNDNKKVIPLFRFYLSLNNSESMEQF